LALTAAAANRDNLVGNGKIDSLNTDGYTQQLGIEWKGEVLFDDSEKALTLLVFPVRTLSIPQKSSHSPGVRPNSASKPNN